MNLPALLDLIADRETTARQDADRLREKITTLTTELTRIDSELADLKVTRTTLRTLAATEFTADDSAIASAPYQQILEVRGWLIPRGELQVSRPTTRQVRGLSVSRTRMSTRA